jgi:hypothetical protein
MEVAAVNLMEGWLVDYPPDLLAREQFAQSGGIRPSAHGDSPDTKKGAR